MAKKIRLTGEIGFEITAAAIIKDLEAASGEDLEIDVASVGGSVFDGIEIYNAILDYKRLHPKASILIRLEGLAASMASYIAMTPAADRVVAEANSIFMLHNPWTVAMGDYREMQKSADFLAGLAGLLKKAYARKSGKSEKAIADWMDTETWLYGAQIKDAGFVDEMLSDQKPAEEKGAAIARAQVAFKKLSEHLRTAPPAPKEKVAAALRIVRGGPAGQAPALGPEAPELMGVGPIQPAAYVAAVRASMEKIQAGDLPEARKVELLAAGHRAIEGVIPGDHFTRGTFGLPVVAGMATDDPVGLQAEVDAALASRARGEIEEV